MDTQDFDDLIIKTEAQQANQLPRNVRKDTKGNTYNIKMYEEIYDAFQYMEIIDIIAKATWEDTIVFDISSGGGDYSGFLALFGAIMQTKAHTVAIVHEACSAASMLALSCDEVRMSPLGYFMIHSFTGGSYGKKNELKDKAEFDEKYFTQVMDIIYTSFLTKEELANVDSGKDMWITFDDAIARLQGWTPIKKRGKTDD